MKKAVKRMTAVLAAGLMVFGMTACGAQPGQSAPAKSAAAPAGGKPYIAIISKGFQHQFWQVVKKGADQAAADLGCTVTFEGPPSESDIQIQVDELKAALDKKPAAICLAALDTESVKDQLMACKNNGVPVVGFDSGVPNAPAGTIYATASTDNHAAAALAADNLMKNADFTAKVTAATASAPVYVGVLSQDATSESITGRTQGFIDELTKLIGADKVDVSGHDKYAKPNPNASVRIVVNIPATTSAADLKSGAEALLTGANKPIAIYGSNEGAAGGILAASNDGQDFAAGGKFAGIVAIGFDAGKTQKVAVTNGWFYGSITQDPYQIGYKAVALAMDALSGKPAASPVVDTGAKWYNKNNITDPMINDLVYD